MCKLGTRNSELGTARIFRSPFRVPRSAFTLIEVLLALTLLAMLMGVLAFTMIGGAAGDLDEGMFRFETALRMLRAEAATTGRTLTLVFDENHEMTVLWRPDPFGEPDRIEPYPGPTWKQMLLDVNKMVRVSAALVDQLDVYHSPTETSATEDSSSQKQPIPPPVEFRPDGSSDTLTFEIEPVDLTDLRRGILEMNGFNSLFTSRILTPEELDEYWETIEGKQGLGMEMRGTR